MMDNAAFEALVFERAEEITRRDKKNRIIRLTAIPTAAAVLVLTAVGITRIPFQSNLSGLADNITAAPYEQYNNADTFAEDEGLAEANEAYSYDDMQIAGSAEFNAENDSVMKGVTSDGVIPNTAVFSSSVSNAQDTVITDRDSLLQLNELSALNEVFDEAAVSDKEEPKGSLTLIYDNSNVEIFIYNNHIEKYTNNSSYGSFILTEETKLILTDIFGIDFS